MSTVSQTPKINMALPANNTILRLLAIAALIVTLVLIISAGTLAAPAARAFDYNAYMLHRQGEWVSVPIPANYAEAYRIFREGEVASPLTNAEAYQLFRAGEVMSPVIVTDAEAYQIHRQGEWASVPVPAVDLSAYHLSERTLVDPQAGMAAYHESERTFVDPETGMVIYFNSERTLIPVRNLSAFSTYQRSEWFGE